MEMDILKELLGRRDKRHGGTHPSTVITSPKPTPSLVQRIENPPNQTTNPQGSVMLWVEGPKVRGTFDILTLCLGTLIICVWDTLHFNIPGRRQRLVDRLVLGVWWGTIVAFFPDALLASAIYQRIDASLLEGYASLYLSSQTPADPGWLTRQLKRLFGKAEEKSKDPEASNTPSPSGNRQFPFGIVHAFYATMGGFSFDVPTSNNAGERSTISSTRRDALTSNGFLYVMQHFPDIIPDISKESITERAESSLLEKAVLIVQVCWFCTSCLSRLIQHLPLSLLEVSTAAHGFCTVLTYFVWVSKPQNIARSTLIMGEGAREVHALLMCSKAEYSDALSMARGTNAEETLKPTTSDQQERIVLAANALRRLPPSSEAPPPEVPFVRASVSTSPFYVNVGLSHFASDQHVPLITTRGAPSIFTQLLPLIFTRDVHSIVTQVVPLIITPLFYGLPHLLGWYGLFPTFLERQLWLISTCVVTGSGLFAFFLKAMSTFLNTPRVGLIMGALTLIVYIVASIFLLVESFRQLLFLDPAAYELASWSNYWPHSS